MASKEYPAYYTGNQHLYPFIHPDYWHGHQLGGAVGKPLGEAVTARPDMTMFVRNALEAYLNNGLPRITEKHYGYGELFQADQHEPGAIAALKYEFVRGIMPHDEAFFIAPWVAPAELDTAFPEGKNMSQG